jgi:hypothetical protein
MTYTAEFDTIDAEQWHRLLQEFDDASIFQTWAYGAANWGDSNLSHALIKEDGEVIGLAQVVLISVPLLGKILAYVIFGPVCQRRGAASSRAHLTAIVAALRDEYVVRRRLCLRLRPWAYDLPNDARLALLAEGLWDEARPLHRTYILDLSRSETQLRVAMDKKWRANLCKAEQSGLVVAPCNDRDGLHIFVELHRQMRERKSFSSPFGSSMLSKFHTKLPEGLRPIIFACWRDEIPVAAAVVSAVGNRAFTLNAATGDAALSVRAGYLLQWTIVRWLKENGRYCWYDLHDSRSSPGVRQFKRGLVGVKAPEIAMSELESCGRPLSALIVEAGSWFYELRRELKGPLARWRSRTRLKAGRSRAGSSRTALRAPPPRPAETRRNGRGARSWCRSSPASRVGS